MRPKELKKLMKVLSVTSNLPGIIKFHIFGTAPRREDPPVQYVLFPTWQSSRLKSRLFGRERKTPSEPARAVTSTYCTYPCFALLFGRVCEAAAAEAAALIRGGVVPYPFS
jgi:hypothetical protein